MKSNLKNLWAAFEEVFAHSFYIALASALVIIAFLFAVWLPNIGLLAEVFGVSSTPLETKLKLAWSLLGGIRTNFSLLSAGYTIAISALFGVNISMVVYFLKRTRDNLARKDVAAGVSGIASGALGIGCAACGSFILSTTFSFLGVASALAILPLRGGEFGILSIALFAFSLVLISKKITALSTCNVSNA